MEHFAAVEAVKGIDWDHWVYSTGALSPNPGFLYPHSFAGTEVTARKDGVHPKPCPLMLQSCHC